MSPIVTNFGCASATQTLMLSPPLAHLHFYGSRGRACSKLLVHVGIRIAVRALGNVLLTSYESLVVSKFSTTNNFSTRPLCSSPQFTGARAVRCESKRVFSSRSARVRRPPTQRSTCLRPSARRRPPPTPAFNSRIYERLHTCSRARSCARTARSRFVGRSCAPVCAYVGFHYFAGHGWGSGGGVSSVACVPCVQGLVWSLIQHTYIHTFMPCDVRGWNLGVHVSVHLGSPAVSRWKV